MPEDDVQEMELPDEQGVDQPHADDDSLNPNIDRKTVLEFASDSTGKLADIDTDSLLNRYYLLPEQPDGSRSLAKIIGVQKECMDGVKRKEDYIKFRIKVNDEEYFQQNFSQFFIIRR